MRQGLPFLSYRRSLTPETLAWVAAVNAAGAGVSGSTQRIVDRYVRDLIANRLWDKIYMLDCCAGTNLTASLVRLKVPSGVARAYTNNNFVAADYTETGSSGGRKGDGTTKYLDTLINPSALGFSATSLMLWAYCRETSAAATTRMIMAAIESLVSPNIKAVALGWVNGGSYEGISIARTNAFNYSGQLSASTGFLGGGTLGETIARYYKNGAAAGVANDQDPQVLPSYSIYANAQNIGGVAAAFGVRRTSQLLITQGLSAAECATLNAIVQAFETALGRNV